jgi:hypothetical protein
MANAEQINGRAAAAADGSRSSGCRSTSAIELAVRRAPGRDSRPSTCVHRAKRSRTSTDHVARSSAMNSRHGLITVIRKCLRRATRPTTTATPQVSDAGIATCASGKSATGAGTKSSSSDSSNRNANVACTRFGDQARRPLSRSRVPRRPRTRAYRPIRRLASDRHRGPQRHRSAWWTPAPWRPLARIVSRPCSTTGTGAGADGEPALAERWNGSRRSVLPTPNPPSGTQYGLESVSCTSARACTAVGTYGNDAFGLAERWNGSRWSIQRTPTPPVQLQRSGSPVAERPSVRVLARGGARNFAHPRLLVWRGTS